MFICTDLQSLLLPIVCTAEGISIDGMLIFKDIAGVLVILVEPVVRVSIAV